MATYSRSDSSSQTTTATQVLPSKDLSSVIVKSLENIVKENNDGKNEQETITDAINNSNLNSLLEKKEKDTNTKQLENLLVKSPSVNKMLTQTLSQNIGKVVGGAVAVSFGAVGKVISGAIGGLQKAVNAPLKTIVTKLALGAAIGSQIFVFLEGALAKFLSEKDLRTINIMSKIDAKIKTIPDRIKLSLEQVLSKVTIMGKPIYGSLTNEEKDQLKELETDKNVLAYKAATYYTKQTDKEIFGNGQRVGIHNKDDYDLNTEEGRLKFRYDYLEKISNMYSGEERDNMIYSESRRIDQLYEQRKKEEQEGRIRLEQRLASGEIDKDIVDTYFGLKARSTEKITQEYFDEKLENLESKESQYASDYVQNALYNQMITGDLTAAEAKKAEEKYGWDSELKAAKIAYQGQYGDYNYAPATGAEQFLDNQYQKWIDSWTKLFRDFTSQMGIVIQQKSEVPNTTRTIGAK